jgi:hypothetical protein
VQPRAVVGEATKDNAADSRRRLQLADDGLDRDISGAIGRKAVDAGGDGGKGNRRQAVGLTEFYRAAIARGQRLVLAFAAVPDRSDGVNDMPRRKFVALGDLGAASFAAMKRAAFGEQFGSGGAMDRAIDAAAAQQRGIRGVDDGVNAQRGDIGDDDFEPRRTDVARSRRQADAEAATVTPLSASNCCSSPAWNISRMMSQPPTNSPLT